MFVSVCVFEPGWECVWKKNPTSCEPFPLLFT